MEDDVLSQHPSNNGLMMVSLKIRMEVYKTMLHSQTKKISSLRLEYLLEEDQA